MVAILLVKLFFWIASGVGRLLLGRVRALSNQPFERFLYSCAIGLGLAGYGVYAIGLAGYLTFWPITIWWIVLAVIGFRGVLANLSDLVSLLRSARASIVTALKGSRTDRRTTRLILISALFLLLFALIGTLACFRAPGPFEWDAISYHLADPKLFLLDHRISSLPTEHHSNFPFLLEMLFVVGLLYNGYALANLFHLGMAILTVLILIAFGTRYVHPLVGWLAGVAFFTVPVVFWEATIAYIDLGLALYLTMATFAITCAVTRLSTARTNETDAVGAGESNARGLDERGSESDRLEWAILAGVAMGFALAMKYLALVPLVLMALVLLWKGFNSYRGGAMGIGQRIKPVLAFVLVAILIGSPWYVKNLIVMRNPVYPFYYRAFPQSRYWSTDRAAAYQSEQDKFGTKPVSTDARSKILNLMSVPWHLLIQRLPVIDGDRNLLYCNPGEFNYTALYGGLLAAICFPLAFLRRVPERIRILTWLGLAQILAWFVLSQVGRYLIQILPVFALVGAYTVFEMAFGSSSGVTTRSGNASRWVQHPFRLPGLLGILMILGQALFVLISVSTLPMNVTASQVMEMHQQGRLPSAVSLPALLSKLSANPSVNTVWNPGLDIWRDDLHRHFNTYDAMEYINSQTRSANSGTLPNKAINETTQVRTTDGVVLFDETRGFYLDGNYLWGNTQHSSYIPYETFHDGRDLVRWMNGHGIRYYLINLLQSGVVQTSPALVEMQQRGEPGFEVEAFKQWVMPPADSATRPDPANRVRWLVGDAVDRGILREDFWKRGCIVLRATTETP